MMMMICWAIKCLSYVCWLTLKYGVGLAFSSPQTSSSLLTKQLNLHLQINSKRKYASKKRTTSHTSQLHLICLTFLFTFPLLPSGFNYTKPSPRCICSSLKILFVCVKCQYIVNLKSSQFWNTTHAQFCFNYLSMIYINF
jgi:hypothetical protein